jgi:hypothetical protein
MHILLLPWYWFLNVTGTHIPAGGSEWYNFWSGFGSDLAEFAILGSLIAVYRNHNCHVKGCWRIGRHKVDGTPYLTCHKHATPDIHKHIHKQHERDYPEQHKLLNASE